MLGQGAIQASESNTLFSLLPVFHSISQASMELMVPRRIEASETMRAWKHTVAFIYHGTRSLAFLSFGNNVRVHEAVHGCIIVSTLCLYH